MEQSIEFLSGTATQPTSPTNLSWTEINNETSSKSSFSNYSSTIVLTSIFFPTAVFGLIANAVTIYVLWRPSMLKSVFNYFIISLAISDLISALISPFFVYRRIWGTKHWQLSTFMCKIYWAVDLGTSVLTSLHVLVFSVLRFASLKWPHQFPRFTTRAAKGVIFTLWLVSIGGVFVPFSIWSGVKIFHRVTRPSCAVHDRKWRKQLQVYSAVGYTIFFFVPCALVIVACCGASLLLIIRRKNRNLKNYPEVATRNERETNRRAKENHAILQLLLIAGSFLLGYLPLCAFYISASRRKAMRHRTFVSQWFGTISYICLRISECLNPVFYNLASSKVRSETFKFFRKVFCISDRIDADRSGGSSDQQGTRRPIARVRTNDSSV